MDLGQLRICVRWRRTFWTGMFFALGFVVAVAVAAAESVAVDDAGSGKTGSTGATAGETISAAEGARREDYLLLPRGELFAPLVADVRWPRFAAEYQWRLGTNDFDEVGQVSFGESFSFVRSPQYDWGASGEWGEWEFGMQAMVDALFDMSQKSFDLSNEDYFVGLTGTVLTRGVTTLFRVYHLSSHLGDEYLAENGVTRGSVSYEAIDVISSYEPREWVRVYAGLGVLVNRTPSYDRVMTQFGIELTSTHGFVSGLITPIFGTDLQLRQENDWIPEVAVLAGLRLASPSSDSRRLEFYARYYHGRSPDGQFFEQTIDSIGLGIRLGF